MFGRKGRWRRQENCDNEDNGRRNTVPRRVFFENAPLLHTIDKNVKNRTQLKAKMFDYHTEENREAHHTQNYEDKGLILRRGQEFRLSVVFDRPIDEEKDSIVLQFVTGSRPQQSKKTILRVRVTESLPTSSWGVKIIQQREATVDFLVMSAVDAIVGVYSVYIETNNKNSDGKEDMFRKELDNKITILFNAWCKEDTVYMENDADRDEYVLNDKGRIWTGSYFRIGSRPWIFGQFEKVSLEACLALFDKSKLKVEARGNPIRVCRVISKLVNSIDDSGVLVGRWGDWPTSDDSATKPWEWKGSVRILHQFLESKRPVKYGQCWVFSGVVTTLLRAIGIPTRSVTNFASAHDTDESMTIDFHVDKDGNSTGSDDSVWNFHVWNESFFTRPDLPSVGDEDYRGWQVHDATPQEVSDGVFQCGPCPVKAIQRGEVYLPYDTGFVFAEVNGDRVYWEVDENGEMKVIKIDQRSVGKFISTKAAGSDERNDITNLYKFPEGSEEERKAIKFANEHSSRKHYDIYSTSTNNDVYFEINKSDNIMIGDDFEIKLALKNVSEETRTVRVTIDSQICYYTGITAVDLKHKIEELTIAGGKEEAVGCPITFGDYGGKMTPDESIKVYFKAKVIETGQWYGDMNIVDLAYPDLEAELPQQVQVNKEFQVTFSFTNPLPLKLKRGKLVVESNRMSPKTVSHAIKKEIGPHEKASMPVNLKFSETGIKFIAATFGSDQLDGVSGIFETKVVE